MHGVVGVGGLEQIPGHPFTMPSFGRMGAFKMSLGL